MESLMFSRKVTLTFGFISLFYACGHGDSSGGGGGSQENLDVSASPNRHNVLVVDDGFDLNHPVFWNKVVARYTLRCAGSDFPFLNPDAEYESQKQKLIKYYQSESAQCRLVKSLPFSPSPELTALVEYRDEWNEAVRTKTVAKAYVDKMFEADVIFNTLNKGGAYHGTHTAGLIAYQNDNVNLFVLQLPLGGFSGLSAQDDSLEGRGCPKQEELDFTAKVFSDPEIIEAYINAPLSTISSQDAAIEDLIKRHKINMVNKSYGLIPREAIERMLKDQGCETDFKALFTAQGNLIAARRAQETEEDDDPVIFQAAGNESVTINSIEDSWDCTLKNDRTILIGGIDRDLSLAEWSNDGSCVELYAVGQNLITPGPLDFLNISSGTSFASPLALRYATKITAHDASPEDILTAIEERKSSGLKLIEEHYPRELVYQNAEVLSSYRSSFFSLQQETKRSENDKPRYLLPKNISHLIQGMR